MGFLDEIGGCITYGYGSSDRYVVDVYPRPYKESHIEIPRRDYVNHARLSGTAKALLRGFTMKNTKLTFKDRMNNYLKSAEGLSFLHYAAIDRKMAEHLELDFNFQVEALKGRLLMTYEARKAKAQVMGIEEIASSIAMGSVFLYEEQVIEVVHFCGEKFEMPHLINYVVDNRKSVQSTNFLEAEVYWGWLNAPT